jgi:hypothetical protein
MHDLVVIVDQNTPRGKWPMGRVMEVYENKTDGHVRSARLKLQGGELTRPINRIIRLELAIEQ